MKKVTFAGRIGGRLNGDYVDMERAYSLTIAAIPLQLHVRAARGGAQFLLLNQEKKLIVGGLADFGECQLTRKLEGEVPWPPCFSWQDLEKAVRQTVPPEDRLLLDVLSLDQTVVQE